MQTVSKWPGPTPTGTPGRPPKYDWPTITDGNVWLALKGEDFDCTPNGFRFVLYQHAYAHGLKVKTQVYGHKVYFQFRKADI